MKRLSDFWLFNRDTSKLNGKKKAAYTVFNWLFVIISACTLGVFSLVLAFGDYSHGIFFGYIQNPTILALNLLAPLLLVLFLYALTGRGWIAYIISAIPVIGLSVADFFVLKFRDDPLMFADILYIREAAQIDGKYDMTPNRRIVFCVVGVILVAALLFLFQKQVHKFRVRIPVAVFLVLLTPLMRWLYFNPDIYSFKTENYDYINRWSSTQFYISKGFVYPFLYSVSTALPSSPEGYDAKTAEKLVTMYETSDIPEDKKVNVVGVMLEAFNDLSRLDIDGISDDVYADYYALKDMSYSGTLVTNIFAGGTIDTERTFLTGYATLQNYRKSVNSYVRYLKSQGYYTEGGHPSFNWFYNRQNINSYLGFDNYYFSDSFYETYTDNFYRDEFMLPYLKKFYDNYHAENPETPYFSFSVTYQGHGPYSLTDLEYGDSFYKNDAVSEESSTIINNYLGSVKDTSANLLKFVQSLEDDDEPFVVVLFGDHKPWLGDGNSVYKELGIDLDTSDEKGFLNYYSTEYVIYANKAAKKVLGDDFRGEGPMISSCFLMNLLFDKCSWEGNSYMKFTNTVMEKMPVINKEGYFDADGKYYNERSDLSDSLRDVVTDFCNAEYYMSENFRK